MGRLQRSQVPTLDFERRDRVGGRERTEREERGGRERMRSDQVWGKLMPPGERPSHIIRRPALGHLII